MPRRKIDPKLQLQYSREYKKRAKKAAHALIQLENDIAYGSALLKTSADCRKAQRIAAACRLLAYRLFRLVRKYPDPPRRRRPKHPWLVCVK